MTPPDCIRARCNVWVSLLEKVHDMPIQFSRLTSISPSVVTKRFEKTEGGNLKREVSAHVSRGRVEPVEVADLMGFGREMVNLGANQALLYGVPLKWRASDLVVQSMLDANPQSDAIARTNRHFHYPSAPGIFMIDYDPAKDGEALQKHELLEHLFKAVPELSGTPLLWYPSTSSHICENGGEDLTGLRGQRVYLAVADATDIPRLGAQIDTRLWAAGQGRFDISRSGALLARTMVDTSVWQPSRLDFAAGAALGPGLEQRRGEPELILSETGDAVSSLPYFDSRALFPDAGQDIRDRAETAKRLSREEVRPPSRARQRAFIHERMEQRLASKGANAGHEETETSILRALTDAVLGPDIVLHLHAPDAPNNLELVTVAKVLGEPDKFDGRIGCDPIEPEYNGWSRTAKLYLSGKQANLFSLAHGGRNYRLFMDRPTITVRPGGMANAVEQILSAMKESGRFMNLGDALVTVDGHKPTLLNEHSLCYRLGKFARFQRIKTVRGEEVLENIDPPDKLCRQLLHIGKSERDLPTLLGVTKGPFIRPSGTLCTRPGFDLETNCYADFVASDFPTVPEAPTPDECTAAHNLLWSPFSELRLDSAASRTALLCAILTAPVRSVIDKSPNFVSLAPDHGSGKTLVTEAIGALATGSRPALMPPLDGAAEEEMRKRLTASLLPPAEPVLILDNLEGFQSSKVLASFLTAASWSDRILGVSRIETELPNRALMLMSGKGLSFKEEIARRTLSWTIDTTVSGPYNREFSFCPVEMVLTRRPEIVVAALTLMRAAHLADIVSKLKMPSFGKWDKLVRQTVLFMNQTLTPDAYEDPLDLVRAATAHSNDRFEAYELLRHLHEWSEGGIFLASKIAVAIQVGHVELQVLLSGITGRPAVDLSARSIGRHLRSLKDRPFNGLTLRAQTRDNMCEWYVEPSD